MWHWSINTSTGIQVHVHEEEEMLIFLLIVMRIYVALAVFQPYLDFEAGDNKSLKFKWRGGESNPGPLAPQAKSLTTRAPLLPNSCASMIKFYAIIMLQVLYK